MLESEKISFRKLDLNDLPLLQKWLTEPHVHEWYDKDKQNTLEEVTKRYVPIITGAHPTDGYIVLYEEKPVAYMQTYKVNDWPEFGDYVQYDDQTASVDLFIGNRSFMGKGFGSMMLRTFLHKIVFKSPEIATCIIGPEPNNKRAIASYEKAGFTYVKTVQVGNEPDLTYIMEIKKVSDRKVI